ncbi:hypothetical protein GA0070624_2018 [Micromonospora rhizosphaerae]|uniref:Uncharacterized protein n=1 Tax=Micromonospora rhizosphaerae TaxID=568872 RepID=A0A1C6RTR1_9ACTN|nr:hypothetical protein [Micromonospora rhizosphaerae]SCL20522.1 hypothetical protein GA0070624_2018 [Micromonospora rhizosphaerae]
MQERRGNRKTWMNLVICVLGVPLVILAGSTGWLRHRFDGNGGWSGRHGDLLEAAGRIFFLFLAASVGILIFSRLRDRLSRETADPEPPADPDVAWLQDLQKSAASRITEDDRKAIAMFVELIVDPARRRSRLTETIDLDERAVVQHVSISFSLPHTDNGGRVLYVPVVQPRKGELVDNFHLRNARGDSLPTMSYEESVRLASAGLRLLIEISGSEQDAPAHRTLGEAERAAELALLQIVATRGPMNSQVVDRKMDVILERIKFRDDESRRRVRKYVAALSSSYPIIAVVPAAEATSGRLLLKYERTFVPSSLTRGWRGLLRLGLGLKPDQVAVPVELALTAESYHLRVNAPSNKYVLKQFLQCRHCRTLTTRKWRGMQPRGMKDEDDKQGLCAHKVGPAVEVDHHFRVRRRRGQNFVHVYMRGYAKASPKMRDLQVFARFKEVPPGGRGRAAVTALATTLLIAVAGNLISSRQGAQVGGLPALMLALPAVAAGWFGMASDKDALVGGSLLARLSLIISGVVSVIAVIYYLGSPPPAPLPPGSVVDHLTFVGITDWRWIVLCAISALNLIYVSYRFTLKLVHYSDLLKREDLGAGEFAWR